jgi:hypothetical protein
MSAREAPGTSIANPDFVRFEHLVALALPSGSPSAGDEAPAHPCDFLEECQG